MALVKTALILAAACAVVSSQSQSCTELRNSDIFLFRRGGNVENACRLSCVTDTGRVRNGLFTCCSGFSPLVTVDTDRRVVDARDGAVLCIHSPTEQRTDPTPVTVDGLPDELQPTTSASTGTQTPTAAESYPSCPTSGPTRFLDFTITARNGGLVCETRCQFGLATNGVSYRVETRTLYQCCEGEPTYRRYRQYDCPPAGS